MSDNPRVPGHPSDMSSSRATGRITDQPASSSNTVSPAPPPVTSPNKIHTKNILIGAIVTIITSTTVFYLTQYLGKKNEGNDFLTMKEATKEAWKSYMAYENIYTKNTLSLTKNPGGIGRDSLLKEIRKESEKFQNDVADLATGKKIDKDLIKVLNRRLENEKNSMPVMEKYYKSLDSIDKMAASLAKKKDAYVNAMSRYSEYTKGAFERAINDIQVIAETLSKRYSEQLSMNDFLVVRLEPQLLKTNDSVINVLRNMEIDSNGNVVVPKLYTAIVKEKDITGNWDADGQLFTFDKNGKMAWVLGNGEKTTGTWKIEDNVLILEGTLSRLKQKGFFRFYVNNITENSLSLISAKDNTVIYYLVRIAHG